MNLRIGLSALQASQFAINNVSHNLANASTEGFHRQEVLFQTNQPDFVRGRFIGSGVDVSDIRRIRDMIIEGSLTTASSDLSRIDQSLLIESRIESMIAPGAGSVQNAFNRLFDNFSRLSANPGENSLRSSIVNEATNLVNRIKDVRGQFVQLKKDVVEQVNLEVAALNQEIEDLVELQNRIKTESHQSVPNDLFDQRDQLINRIAERVDVQRYELVQNELGLALAGSSISIGAAPIRFEAITDTDGFVQLQIENGNRPIQFAGGRIAALVDAKNNLIDSYEQKIDTFASELINQFNQLHATGVGIEGPFSRLQSNQRVSDVNALLTDEVPFPINAGDLSVTITSPSGELTTTVISIDPTTDSLNSVAAKLTSVNRIQALVDPASGRLSVIAEPGYKFDFTGRLETIPDTAGFTGTSVPRITGDYTGESNETYTITALSTGTIGKTAGLRIQVEDSGGNILNEFDVGEGYEADSPINLGNGVSIQLGVGDINSGDSFDVRMFADADTSGLLSAIGLNSFFIGEDAGTIDLAQRITDSPDLIATSRSGDIADTRNLKGLLDLRHQQSVGDRNLTFENFLAEANSEIGFRVQSSQNVQVSLSELKFEYETKREAVSGVNVNEELIQLSQHQKTYEAAIQVVRTMESMLDELFQIIR